MDPAVQVKLSYLHYWMDSSRRKLVEASCCPSILVAIAGPHMCIMGAMLLDKVVVQHFTGWMHIAEDSAGGEDDHNNLGHLCVERLAQVFVSLRHAVEALTNWYQTNVSLGIPSFTRFFPWINCFEHEGKVTQFVYLRGLQAHAGCKTFLVQKTDVGQLSELLVVKFVPAYGDEVHRFMASRGLAPNLHHCAPLADMFPGHHFKGMVIVAMDAVSGKNLEDEYGGSVVPKEVADKIVAVLRTLWDAGWVHGDIRAPNLIIDDSGSVKLIDYDWAGAEGKVKYPRRISIDLFTDVVGVVGEAKIIRKHDEEMVGKLFEFSAPDSQ
ncbi:hypothetical protein HETIRDRAFT_436122 [Heterobasidion irregulare TC 32-1]|uniref:Protein kinase domain-containing protein n=1 Tax=Heterobasidion irregulare (strain TC 32-1) TaxID=747525 RepID=W4JTZ2_HETIT|nr:uncharacterized protein HETIRDRAFT_436122 [Heterobasidion irregulare TC 32-1]ETW77023.1 hypothetical protein HETIRDRAFT_436122 [Heterobasidion irregulare TC 32-1]